MNGFEESKTPCKGNDRDVAVAWSSLGDVALAEEAAQETFIRGYQRPIQLTDGAKFPGWITAMARNIAINLSPKHYRAHPSSLSGLPTAEVS